MEISKENTVKEIICRTVKYDSGVRVFHWHENIEICRVVSGKASFLVDGTMLNLNAGDILVVGEQLVHQFLVENENTYIRICQLSPKVLLDKNISPGPIQPHISNEQISAIPNLSERIENLFDIIQTDGGADHIEDVPYMKAVAATVYYLLMQYFPGETDTKSNKERQLFYKITEYINGNFSEDVTVQSIAERFFVSRGKVGSVFFKYSGETLKQYLNTIRVKNANLLMDSGHSITESALESGFQNVRTFNVVYRKIMGITPSEYIKK